jgi:hypothetical protein
VSKRPKIRRRQVAALAAVALALAASPAGAQDSNGKERTGKSWRLDELRNAFCIQFLVDPAQASRRLPRGTRPVSASQARDLHPALRGVVEGQSEFATWVPSSLCLYYFGLVEVDGNQVRDRNPSKSPMLGFWTMAAADSLSGKRQDLALEVITNNGRLESSANAGGLDIRSVRSSFGPVPPDEEGASSGLDRYQIRIGKTQIIWDGRAGFDSTAPGRSLARGWRAEGKRGGWVNGDLALSPNWSRAMIGSLRVEGKDDLAKLLKASPIRFVGPVYQGGTGSLQFGR